MTEYTEREVDKMLKEQEANIRLNNLEVAFKDLSKLIHSYMLREEAEMKEIVKALEANANERRACEAGIRKDMHGLFVKKAELKIYALLIVAASSITTGIITYIGNKDAESNQALTIDRVEKLFEKKLSNYSDLKSK